jgi:hypothetical protein
MSDLIRQSVSWPSIFGARSYSRVTQLASAPAPESADKAEKDRPSASKAEDGAKEPGPRRGSLLDLSV